MSTFACLTSWWTRRSRGKTRARWRLFRPRCGLRSPTRAGVRLAGIRVVKRTGRRRRQEVVHEALVRIRAEEVAARDHVRARPDEERLRHVWSSTSRPAGKDGIANSLVPSATPPKTVSDRPGPRTKSTVSRVRVKMGCADDFKERRGRARQQTRGPTPELSKGGASAPKEHLRVARP